MPNTIEEPGYTNSATELHYIHAGSLHNHQYSHLFADFRNRRDRYQTDFFANSITATMVNRQYCINLNTHAFGGDHNSLDPYLRQPYETYGPNCWGLMAGIPSYTGYAVMQPIVMYWDNFSADNIAVNSDSGTVVLSAPLGSTPFTPRQTIDFTRNILTRFQARENGYSDLVGRYGFMNSFNLGRPWNQNQIGHFAVQIIGLDVGANIGSIENMQSGLVWKLAMRNEFIARGMQAAGFYTGNVEPFVVNFDDNPPIPNDDTNGGGEDPNSFGGYSGTFGSANASFREIQDPFPDKDYGPQQWVQYVSSSADHSGVFITLNNHSVSRWGRLSFWIRGEQGNESYNVGLKDRMFDRLGYPLQYTEVQLPIADYHPAGHITSEWTEVRIPLSEFAKRGVRLTGLDNVSFTCTDPTGGDMYIDDIAFLPDEAAPSQPLGLSADTSTEGQVVLTWNENPENDVVGYRIYRSIDKGETFTQLNQFLTVNATYTDTEPSDETNEYQVTAVDNAAVPNESTPSAPCIVSFNQPPHINPIQNYTINEGQVLEISVSATDPNESDTLVLSATLADGSALDTIGAVFTDHGDGTGSFYWKPDRTQGTMPGTEYYIQFLARDTAGAADQQMMTVTVLDAVDTTAPTVTIVSPRNGDSVPATGFSFTGTADDDASGVKKVIVSVYDCGRSAFTVNGEEAAYAAANRQWDYAMSPDVLTPGKTAIIRVYAEDTVGNTSSLEQICVHVAPVTHPDTLPPAVTITAPCSMITVSAQGFYFAGSAQDASGIKDVRVSVFDHGRLAFTADNEKATYTAATHQWRYHVSTGCITPGKAAVLRVRAEDNAGNVSCWQYRTVWVKRTSLLRWLFRWFFW